MSNALIRDRRASAIVKFEPTGWNMPWNRTGSPVSTPNGTMSSISSDHVTDAHRVPQPIIADVDRRTLGTQHFSHQWSQCRHRATELATEHLHKLVQLLLACLLIENNPNRQFPAVITFGVSAIAATL